MATQGSYFIVLFAAFALSEGTGDVTPIWNMYKWGPNAQAWCRFRCQEKLPAGQIFRINFSGPTREFTTYGNLKLLSSEGNSYVAENNYDMWPWGDAQFCQFQFGLVFEGTDLQGNCSFYDRPPYTKPAPARQPTSPRGLDLATWDNTFQRQTRNWRYQGRCTVGCLGTYEPGTLVVRVDVDKDTTNFNGFGAFTADQSATGYTRSWTVVNRKRIKSQYGLCHFDFELNHQNEYPIPSGICYTHS